MAHHHNVVQVLKTPNGYIKSGDTLQFTDNIKEARTWGYWDFAFNKDEKFNIMRKLGLDEDTITKSHFIHHEL